jgi:predicted nucleic acid-binding protein
MSKRLVVDASVVIAIVRSEPERDDLQRILEERKRAGVALIAPAGLWLEVVNSLVRRHRTGSEHVLQAIKEIDDFGIELVDIGRPLLILTLDLAERFGLTSYDASYLAVAMVEDADLVTLDGDLAVAAGDRAVAVGGPPRLHEAPAVYEHDVTWPRYKEASAYLAKLRAEALAARSG